MSSGLDEELLSKIRLAHAITASLAWVVFFPVGAIAIRIPFIPGRIALWAHGLTQTLAYALYIVGVGLGIKITMMLQATGAGLWENYHPIIGLIIFILAFFQPIFGFAHHELFKKYKQRTIWSQLHLWIGRILITASIINGGLGLYITEDYQKNTTEGEIIYGVVGGVIWLVYVAAAIWGELYQRPDIQEKIVDVADKVLPMSVKKETTTDSDTDMADSRQVSKTDVEAQQIHNECWKPWKHLCSPGACSTYKTTA